jgi:sugar/nucleoside kinase (ribokinase family)
MKKFHLISLIFLLMQISNEREITEEKNRMQLMGFGSPIVDGVINYESDPALCEKTKKSFNYHMSEDFPLEFYLEVLNSEHTTILLGGSALNTIRATNFILKQVQENPKIGFVGAIGKDDHGEFIQNRLQKEKVHFFNQLFEQTEIRTSTTIVLIEQHDITFFSDLGASLKITEDFFKSLSNEISKTKIFYADAYLIGQTLDCFKYVFQNAETEAILAI